MVKEVIGGQVPDWQIAEFMETRNGDVEAGAMSGFAEGYQRAVPQGMDVVEEDDDDEDNGVVILDSWTANSVKQDRDGWPKYLGTLEYEVALIGNRPLAVGSNVSFAVQEDNSMGAHLVARHPDTGVRGIIELLGIVSKRQYLAMDVLFKLTSRERSAGRARKADNLFLKKKPLTQLFEALESQADRFANSSRLLSFVGSQKDGLASMRDRDNAPSPAKTDDDSNPLPSIYGASSPDSGLQELPTPPELTSSLLPHQRRGLWWLVNREKEVLVTKAKKPGVVIDLDSSHEVVDLCDDDDGGGEEGDTASLTTTTTDDSMEGAEEGLQTKRLPEEIHPMWKPATFPDGTKFYYSDYNEAIRHVPSLTPHRGGILADDQGLGKTIQSLSLILTNKGSSSTVGKKDATGRYSSNATLIVVPWAGEVKKHTKAKLLDVLLHHGPQRWNVPVTRLAQADIVITSYATLSKEHEQQQSASAEGSEKQTKRKKKKPKAAVKKRPIQLLSIRWHRVILDEAHLIRSRNTLMAKGTFSLIAERRWCLTGTPIQNQLDDLFSLIHFLHAEPFAEYRVWKNVIAKPYERNDPRAAEQLRNLLGHILLRRTKAVLSAATSSSSSSSSSSSMLKEDEEEAKGGTESRKRRRTTASSDDDDYEDATTELEEDEDEVEEDEEEEDKRRGKRKRVENQDDFVLPPRVVETVALTFSEDESDFYNGLYQQSKIKFDSFVKSGTVLQNYATVLELLLRLRQACNHPFLVLESLNKSRKKTAQDFEAFLDSKFFENSASYFQTLRTKLLATVNKTREGDGDEAKKEEDLNDDIPAASDGDEELGCAICLADTVAQPSVTPCGHLFCRECIDGLFMGRPQPGDGPKPKSSRTALCPTCRREMTYGEVRHVPVPQEMINIKPEEQWKPSTKFQALVDDLNRVEEEDPLIKSVIFSQWTSTLDLVEIALKKAGYAAQSSARWKGARAHNSFLRLDGSMSAPEREKVIATFYADPQAKVILISLKAGGLGLNVTCASHVYLLDPWWNPSAEEQAIDRVHRIGQKRPVHVKKFVIQAMCGGVSVTVVNGTVEEKILQLQEKKASLVAGALASADEKKQERLETIVSLFSD
ncbi:SNF2 family protein [Acanthamoeba castellanii str. Neff]|uniref:SNF2 family protein n=1 Tax=Acanthamoeba castellanii (strain ATCC 30010 / Neff) TaxID=1257118 RepID=L8GCK9_ACACF|nr:SNF2 family protein [Acanthamoeba castellanii str. Neff]ELR10812.1 SNF2 family protein [Acanthamoeba castellanii str. Neff]